MPHQQPACENERAFVVRLCLRSPALHGPESDAPDAIAPVMTTTTATDSHDGSMTCR